MSHAFLLFSFSFAILPPMTMSDGERYYVMVFASQKNTINPNHTHSFAAFIKVTETKREKRIEHHTISWMSDSGKVKLLKLFPETGRNLGLHETIQWAMDRKQTISFWGPYEIHPELYHLARQQIAGLEQTRKKYKTLDSFYPTRKTSNCIHAISDIAGNKRLRVASPFWGNTASYWVLRRYVKQGYVLDANTEHCWLLEPLGLHIYPLRSRDFSPLRRRLLRNLCLRISTCGPKNCHCNLD